MTLISQVTIKAVLMVTSIASVSEASVTIDDPVKVYLKEIGRVPLLSSDEKLSLQSELVTEMLLQNSAFPRQISSCSKHCKALSW